MTSSATVKKVQKVLSAMAHNHIEIRKSRIFYELIPMIENLLITGCKHDEILKKINENGLSISSNTYHSYLRRFRSKNKKGSAVKTITVGEQKILPESAPSTNKPVTKNTEEKLKTQNKISKNTDPFDWEALKNEKIEWVKAK